MCNAPNFEDVEGYIGLGLSMGQPICPSVRGLRLHSWNFLEFHTLINHANERTIFFFFFVAFGVAELHLFIKSFVLTFPL